MEELMLLRKNCLFIARKGTSLLFKNLVLMFLLVSIISLILMEDGHGECIPYSLIGCREEDKNAPASEVAFEYPGQFFPNYKTVRYTIKLANSVKDGTTGELFIYSPKLSIPGNPDLNILLWNGDTISRDHKMEFQVDFLKDVSTNMILGNLSNKLFIEEETYEFEGPYMIFNIGRVIIKPTDDGRYIDRIIVDTRANETIHFGMELVNRKTGDPIRFEQTRTYRLEAYNHEFTELAWVPSREAEPKEIEYFEGDITYEVRLIPSK